VELTGTVADPATGLGIQQAMLRLRSLDGGTPDTIVVFSDSSGGFTVPALALGRYAVTVGSRNYHLLRDTIVVVVGLDTLRPSIQRALPVCSVRATSGK
jgi:hypothetical protein